MALRHIIPWVLTSILGLGCSARVLELPVVDGGQAIPSGALQVKLMDLDPDVRVSVVRPGDTHPSRRLVVRPETIDPIGTIRDFVAREVSASAARAPEAAQIPVVVMADREQSAQVAMNLLVEPTRDAARKDPRIQAFLGVNSVGGPRMVEAPLLKDQRVNRMQERTPLLMVINSTSSMEGVLICKQATRGVREPKSCTTLIDEGAPSPERRGVGSPNSTRVSTEITPRLMHDVCTAIGEPFDIVWDGDSFGELAEVLTDDPRPDRCRGRLVYGSGPSPKSTIVLRPSEIRGSYPWAKG